MNMLLLTEAPKNKQPENGIY